jgi:hypothetical protein
VIRELVTQPFKTAVALIELPATVHRSLRQANDLMEQSQRQLEAMQTQTDEALKQAERMNDLLTKVVKLTEPLEYAQRGGEHVAGRLKRALFGEELEQAEQAVDDAEEAAADAEEAAAEAEDAATVAEQVDEEKEVEEPAWKPAAAEDDAGGIEVTDSGTVRVIPSRPPPGDPAPGA